MRLIKNMKNWLLCLATVPSKSTQAVNMKVCKHNENKKKLTEVLTELQM